MGIKPDVFLEELYDKNPARFHFRAQNADEWKSWREQLKASLRAHLGMDRIPCEDSGLYERIVENVDMGWYVRQRVEFKTADKLDMLAYVLIPKSGGGRRPAVIACHGHGYGSRAIVGLTPEGLDNSSDPDYQKNFALELARKGFLVIAPEIIGFGDRRLEEDAAAPLGQSSCHRLSTFLLMMGTTTAGLRAFETMRTIDYLESRDDVDSGRIGCIGISGGGMVCTLSAALDERIKAAVVSGYANTFKDSIMSIYHCVDNFIPGISLAAEMPDILGLIAPHPLLLEAGTRDHIFPIGAVRKAFEALDGIYTLLGCRDRLDIDDFEGVHEISGKKAYDWFCRWL